MHDFTAANGVEGGGRLVGEEDARLGEERPGDRDPLLLPPRELTRHAPSERVHPKLGEEAPGPLALGARRRVVKDDRHEDVVQDREEGNQMRLLKDEADIFSAIILESFTPFPVTDDRHSANFQRSTVGILQET
jgi:hypothetical protein